MALRITARMCIGASEGASGYAALRRAAPPHGPSPWLGSGPRHIRAIRYAQLLILDLRNALIYLPIRDSMLYAVRGVHIENHRE